MIIGLADDFLIGLCWVSALFLHFCFLLEFSVYFFLWLAKVCFFFHREYFFVLDSGGRGGQDCLVYGIYMRHLELEWRLQLVFFYNLGIILWIGN